MPVDYSQLAQGQEISSRSFTLDEESVSRYRDAVGDSSQPISDENNHTMVPSMAVAALSLGGVINDLQIPGGTVHAGQELDFTKSVSVGETLECRATLVQNSVRGEWRFMIVNLQSTDSEGQTVMEGKSTIMLPAS